MSKLLAVVISLLRHRTVCHANPEHALRMAEADPPGIAIVDLQLPRMDGLELTRRLKADPGRRDIIIIALTAYAMKGDDDKAFAAGCDGYMSKPIDIVDVCDAITTNRPYRATASPEHACEELSGDVAAGARRRDMVEALIALGHSGQLAERAAAVRSGGVASTVVRQPR